MLGGRGRIGPPPSPLANPHAPQIDAIALPMRVSPSFCTALAASGMFMAGCAGDANPDFDSLQSTGRIKAAVSAAAGRDEQAVPDLIAMLVSDDPAERFIGIASLKRITGQTLGYDPAAPEGERQLAVARWRTFASEEAPAQEKSVGLAVTGHSQLAFSPQGAHVDLPDARSPSPYPAPDPAPTSSLPDGPESTP